MKTNESKPSSIKRSQYSPQFKEQAVERANRDGVPKAAQDLGIAQSMLYNWVTKSRQTGQPNLLKIKNCNRLNSHGCDMKMPDRNRS
ncbi:MAG: hypothetical protein BVN35_19830 [Proteobacteria bacterium ST_bin11]|nr:MAG: hypothetical protein BVN35_19830 [Proteobacteria bacterium ST_bin11]